MHSNALSVPTLKRPTYFSRCTQLISALLHSACLTYSLACRFRSNSNHEPRFLLLQSVTHDVWLSFRGCQQNSPKPSTVFACSHWFDLKCPANRFNESNRAEFVLQGVLSTLLYPRQLVCLVPSDSIASSAQYATACGNAFA